MEPNRIQELCDSKNISIKKLAKMTGLSFSGLYSAIRNNSLKIETLEKIAVALKVPITAFFDVEVKDIMVFTENDIVEIEKEIAVFDVTGDVRKNVDLNKYKNNGIPKNEVLMQLIFFEARIGFMQMTIDRLKKEINILNKEVKK